MERPLESVQGGGGVDALCAGGFFWLDLFLGGVSREIANFSRGGGFTGGKEFMGQGEVKGGKGFGERVLLELFSSRTFSRGSKFGLSQTWLTSRLKMSCLSRRKDFVGIIHCYAVET